MALTKSVALLRDLHNTVHLGVGSIGRNPGSPEAHAASAEAHRRGVAAADADLETRYEALRHAPPSPDMRDAELRLAGAMTTFAEIVAATALVNARIDEATAPVTRLEAARADAQATLDAARADVARFDAAESEAIVAWASSGEGDKPAPRAGKRRVLDDAAANAQRIVAHIDAALGEKRAALGAVTQEGMAIGRQRDAAVVTILYETAETIAVRYAASLAEAARCAAELEGLNHALGGLRGGDLFLADGTKSVRPAITDDTGDVVYEQRIAAKAYRLRAHHFGRSGYLCAIATTADIRAAAMRWAAHVNRLIAMSQGADPGELSERAALLAENAALAAQLAAAGGAQDEEITACT